MFFNKCALISNIDTAGRTSYESPCGVWIPLKKLKLAKAALGATGLCFSLALQFLRVSIPRYKPAKNKTILINCFY